MRRKLAVSCHKTEAMKFKIPSIKKIFKSRLSLGLVALSAAYLMIVDVNLQQRQRMLEDHDMLSRDLKTKDLGGGLCTINPTADGDPAPADATKTLLASYPGSGKRFTWTVIKALTNHEIADDWDFAGNINKDPITVKTSWPHKEGKWNWGAQMDQVLLLVRNPRWAIPSYHNMRFELGYSTNYMQSYVRMPNTYTDRPALAAWEGWRDSHIDVEITRWVNFVDFWMQGGVASGSNETVSNCLVNDIDCKPKAVIDFDNFYQIHPTTEFYRLNALLSTSANVELIAAGARTCVLDSVYNTKELHQANRDSTGTNINSSDYVFTVDQLELMLSKITELRDKYAAPPYAGDEISQELVTMLSVYINDLALEIKSGLV